jgi:outer membrane protein TolC
MIRSFFVSILLLLLCTLAATGQQQASLSELLERTKTNAPRLITDAAAIGIKSARLEAIRYNWLPALKLNYQADIGTNNNLPGGYFSYGIVPSNSRVRVEGNSSSVFTDLGIASLDWEIYNFGMFKAEQQVAASDLEAEELNFANAQYNIQYNVVNDYLQLLRLNDLIQIQYQNILRNIEIKRTIRALAIAGIKAGVDTSIAEAELSKSRLIYLELNNQFKQVQLLLSYNSGIDSSAIQPDTLLENRLINTYADDGTFPPDTVAHPAITLYRSLYQNSLDRENLVKKTYLPKISLQAAAWGRGSSISAADQFRSLGKGIGFERGNYLVGLGITYNILDYKHTRLQLKTQMAATQYAQKKLEEQKALISSALGQADVELSTANDRLREIPQQLNAARAAYRQKLALYRNGLTNIIELNTALSVLYRAETDYTNAKFLFCKALFQKAITGNQLTLLLNSLK